MSLIHFNSFVMFDFCITVSPFGVYQRAKNAYITVALKEEDIFYTPDIDANICGYHNGTLNRDYTLISCNVPITGQFVQIQLYTTDFLNLYEVEVHGT